MATDTSDGSKTVLIDGKEIMLKDSSSFKKSTGDEAATKSLGMGVVTHQITGKVYFTSWSMDVKIEGENAVRHLDMMTHNHMSTPGNTVPWLYQDLTAFGNPPECEADTERMQRECAGSTSTGPHGTAQRTHHENCSPDCEEAMACILVPKNMDKELCCKPNNTGHHMIEDHWVAGNPNFAWYGAGGPGTPGYENAPTVCVNRYRSQGTHKEMHDIQGVYEESYMPGGARQNEAWNYQAGKRAAMNAHDSTFGDSECSPGCIEAQLDAYYGDEEPNRPLNAPGTQPLGGGRADTLDDWGPTIG
jgi:hypothetical protein